MNKGCLSGCAIVAGVVVLAIIGGLIWLGSGPEGGVKMVNEMDEYATTYLAEHNILQPDEKLIAYYDATMGMTGEEAAILTDQRVIYHRKGENTVFLLEDIEDIQSADQGIVGTVIEIYDEDTGATMKIEIAPLNSGASFDRALRRAWAAKTGATTPEEPEEEPTDPVSAP